MVCMFLCRSSGLGHTYVCAVDNSITLTFRSVLFCFIFCGTLYGSVLRMAFEQNQQ